MNVQDVVLSALWLALQPVQSILPTQVGPMRNTFVVAAETVIDNADAIDFKSDEATFSAQMQQLKSANENLRRMAEDDRERDAASAAGDLIFAVQACHLQAKDGASTDACQAQVGRANTRAMESINKHKSGGAWVDGPPAR